MKLTGELKDKVDKTESMVEKKDIIAQAGMELTDDELEMVVSGYKVLDYEGYEKIIESENQKHLKDFRDKYFR